MSHATRKYEGIVIKGKNWVVPQLLARSTKMYFRNNLLGPPNVGETAGSLEFNIALISLLNSYDDFSGCFKLVHA
jgi:hypothetical protein